MEPRRRATADDFSLGQLAPVFLLQEIKRLPPDEEKEELRLFRQFSEKESLIQLSIKRLTKVLDRLAEIEAGTARVSKEGNPKAEPWKDIIEQAQGLIIVTPEYNHSFPGELKLLLDSLFDEYEGLVVGVVGVSSGGLGGARAVEHIKPILTNFKMIVTRSAVLFSNVKELFDRYGNIKDESYNEKTTKFLDEIKWWAERLKGGEK